MTSMGRLSVVAVLSLASCKSKPPTLDSPDLRVAGVFPELASGSLPPQVDAGQPAERQIVPIGHVISGTLPRDFSDWTVAADDGCTLAVHRNGEEPADAWIYAEPFTSLAESTPSIEAGRWLLVTAPSLVGIPQLGPSVRRWMPDGLLPAAAAESAAGEPASAPGEASDAAPVEAPDDAGTAGGDAGPSAPPAPAPPAWLPAMVRTLGDGVGVEVQPASFTGWRWMGSLESRLQLRLSRVDGVARLGEHTNQHAFLAFLAERARSNPGLQRMFMNERRAQGLAARFPAYVVVGLVSTQEHETTGSGAGIAIACRKPCAAAPHLAAFLSSLRPRATSDPSPRETTPDDLALSFGMRLAPIDAMAWIGARPPPPP